MDSFDAISSEIQLLTLVSTATKATILLIAGLLLTLPWSRLSAATRHHIWSLTVVGLLILPLLSASLPSWEAPFLSVLSANGSDPDGPPPIERRQVPTSYRALVKPSIQTLGPGAVLDGAPKWSQAVVIGWLCGALVLLARIPIQRRQVRKIAQESQMLDDPRWMGLLEDLTNQLRIRRRVVLLRSSDETVPVTWGLFHPVVLLPAGAVIWSEERRRVVLLHELVHVVRLDSSSQVMAQIACSFYWFHPLAWLASSQMRKERERASDDQVVCMGIRPTDYASHLLELARLLKPQRNSLSATVAMAHRLEIEQRLLAILNPKINHQTLTCVPRSLIAAAILGLLLSIASAHTSGDSRLRRLQPLPERIQRPKVNWSSNLASPTSRGAIANSAPKPGKSDASKKHFHQAASIKSSPSEQTTSDERVLSRYERAGPISIDRASEIREFLWEHWRGQRLGHLTVTRLNQLKPQASDFWVEPDGQGRWIIVVEASLLLSFLENRKESHYNHSTQHRELLRLIRQEPSFPPAFPDLKRDVYDLVERIDSSTQPVGSTIPEAEAHNPSTYKLRLINQTTQKKWIF